MIRIAYSDFFSCSAQHFSIIARQALIIKVLNIPTSLADTLTKFYPVKFLSFFCIIMESILGHLSNLKNTMMSHTSLHYFSDTQR